MLFRKPFSMWICVSLFIASITLVPLIGRLSRQPTPPPRTLAELRELLSQDAPLLTVVPMSRNDVEFGMYICAHPSTHEQLSRLLRNSQNAGRWQGVIFCERVTKWNPITEEELRTWGKHGMQIGSLLFFGDPELLERLRTVILGKRHA